MDDNELQAIADEVSKECKRKGINSPVIAEAVKVAIPKLFAKWDREMDADLDAADYEMDDDDENPNDGGGNGANDDENDDGDGGEADPPEGADSTFEGNSEEPT